ncbi:hypothetical protein EIP73_01180 [Xylella fastidiosa subsp. pauca]|nr:hypothetical protein EIP73_01180 [Xylella fastidiosa subsp. pauca]
MNVVLLLVQAFEQRYSIIPLTARLLHLRDSKFTGLKVEVIVDISVYARSQINSHFIQPCNNRLAGFKHD